MIDRFDGEHGFLSNFEPATVHLEGVPYPTVEHAFQAAKAYIPEQQEWVRKALTAREAKNRGRRVTLRSDWEEEKVRVMTCLVFEKFLVDNTLRERLLATGNEELVEGNNWGDTFWGVCEGEGQNYLGKILMSVRASLRGDTSQLIKFLTGGQ